MSRFAWTGGSWGRGWMVSALLAVSLLGACERTVGFEDDGDNFGEETWIYPQSDHREVDLLFVVDNSGSMEGEQRPGR